MVCKCINDEGAPALQCDGTCYDYDMINPAKVMNLIDPLRIAISNLESQMEARIGKNDQLKFFDYIYPSISQRLTALENNSFSKIESKELIAKKEFKLKDYVTAYYGHYTRSGQITDINKKGLINIDNGKLYFHPNQLRFQGEEK